MIYKTHRKSKQTNITFTHVFRVPYIAQSLYWRFPRSKFHLSWLKNTLKFKSWKVNCFKMIKISLVGQVVAVLTTYKSPYFAKSYYFCIKYFILYESYSMKDWTWVTHSNLLVDNRDKCPIYIALFSTLRPHILTCCSNSGAATYSQLVKMYCFCLFPLPSLTSFQLIDLQKSLLIFLAHFRNPQ